MQEERAKQALLAGNIIGGGVAIILRPSLSVIIAVSTAVVFLGTVLAAAEVVGLPSTSSFVWFGVFFFAIPFVVSLLLAHVGSIFGLAGSLLLLLFTVPLSLASALAILSVSEIAERVRVTPS